MIAAFVAECIRHSHMTSGRRNADSGLRDWDYNQEDSTTLRALTVIACTVTAAKAGYASAMDAHLRVVKSPAEPAA